MYDNVLMNLLRTILVSHLLVILKKLIIRWVPPSFELLPSTFAASIALLFVIRPQFSSIHTTGPHNSLISKVRPLAYAVYYLSRLSESHRIDCLVLVPSFSSLPYCHSTISIISRFHACILEFAFNVSLFPLHVCLSIINITFTALYSITEDCPLLHCKMSPLRLKPIVFIW